MKKTAFSATIYLSALFGIVIAMGSCKKESTTGNEPGNSHYIRFKVNGLTKEYAASPLASFPATSSNGLFTALLGAFENTVGADKPQLSILFFSETPFTGPAVYEDPQKVTTTDGVKEPKLIITYYEAGQADGYQSMGLFSDLAGDPGFEQLVADAKASITELTSTYVKGNFSATTFKSTDLVTIRSITAGEFYLPKQ